MSLVNAKLREKIEKHKMRQATLRAALTECADAIPVLINPHLAEAEDLRIAEAATKMDDLVRMQAELISIRSKIWELEEQL